MMTDFAGTERNPLFIEQALEAVGGDKDKKVVVMCSIGGTLQTYVERKGLKPKKYADPERMFGRQSRYGYSLHVKLFPFSPWRVFVQRLSSGSLCLKHRDIWIYRMFQLNLIYKEIPSHLTNGISNAVSCHE
ncbi:hypothetical protein KP509_1Z327000 [Ceratopteris richardii]|nr:hypothetical protein KP509_1Z327000 [Ceratopteris richardii]